MARIVLSADNLGQLFRGETVEVPSVRMGGEDTLIRLSDEGWSVWFSTLAKAMLAAPDGPTQLFLSALDGAAGEIRAASKFGAPGEVIWKADCADEEVLVIADGLGGATLMRVEGNYPVDFMNKGEMHFEKEAKACEEAAKWVGD